MDTEKSLRHIPVMGEAKCNGEYVALELDMENFLSRTFVGTLESSKFIDTIYRMMQIRENGELVGLVFDELEEIRCPQTKRRVHGRSSYVQLPLQFGYYSPDTEDTRPLIIWLHWAGEGGLAPRTTYIGGCSNNGFMTMRMVIDYQIILPGINPSFKRMSGIIG